MDPNPTLNKLRELTKENSPAPMCGMGCGDVIDEFAENFDALDGWLKRGGFLPTAWADRMHRYEDALRLIGKLGCEHTTHAPSDFHLYCKDDGRTPDAEFLADKWCDGCIANSVLPPASDDPWQGSTAPTESPF